MVVVRVEVSTVVGTEVVPLAVVVPVGKAAVAVLLATVGQKGGLEVGARDDNGKAVIVGQR